MVVQTRANPKGPRFLTQRNLEKTIQASNGDEDPNRPVVTPGFMQLFSYYKPGLTAGNYAITAEQFISSKNGSDTQSLRICNFRGSSPLPDDQPSEPQIFEVMAPQFLLDLKLVNSFYPPEGHQDEGRILPHIVLNDPHFPWERDADKAFSGGVDDPDPNTARLRDPDLNAAGQTLDKAGNVTTVPKDIAYRSIVPWIRLLVFDVEELKLDSAQQAHDLGVPNFADLTNPKADIKRQPANGAFPMTAKDYFNIKSGNRIDFESAFSADPEGFNEISQGRRSKEATQIIYPTKDTFYKLCQNVESNKYLAHVRNINTVGFPNAGVEENGLFSIVISGRTGKFDITRPTTQVVHLLSIENVHSTLQSQFQNWDTRSTAEKSDRIGLISLFSWTYTALPPNPINFIDTMMKIVGNRDVDDKGQDLKLQKNKGQRQMLRAPDLMIDGLASQPDAQSKLLATRLKLGYSIARWRCETGEVTAAFNRGPLTPIQVPGVPSTDWPTGSQTGRNFQIFDKTTGVMDLSYSSAWNLGKTLAIADTSFSAALMRFRSEIHNASASIARASVNGVASRNDTIKQLLDGVKRIQSRLNDNVQAPNRVIVPTGRVVDTNLTNPNIANAMTTAIHAQVTVASQAGDEVFNEFNTTGENSTDWAIILRWITDKLYLSDIPAHVLFPDPIVIPEETLRFFFIDDVWMDCLIDGALSVGNHLESDDDQIKAAIKALYNLYLSTSVPTKVPNVTIKPQIPCYGFVLRSQIVKVMPDLRINVNWATTDGRAPVCQWLRPDDHTLICLLDRPPEELAPYQDKHPDLSGIVLSQPPHQQRFSFGYGYNASPANSFEFKLRHLYTKDAPDGEWLRWDHSGTTPPNQPEALAATKIDLISRVLDTSGLASAINKGIQQQVGEDQKNPTSAYIDFVPNSAELALELNDPAYYFTIYPDQPFSSSNGVQRVRQLWTLAPSTSSASPGVTSPPSKVAPGPIGTPIPIHPPKADVPVPVIPITEDVPGKAGKVTVRDHGISPVSTISLPPTQMPKKCFTMDVFVDYRGLRLRQDGVYDPGDYVPTQSKYLTDLIFSIRKGVDRTDPRNDQMLREIVIHVPNTPDPSEATKTDALISKDWTGRARLLANQRFVTFTSRTDKYLEIRLIPRSADINPVIKLNDNKTLEASFTLTDVDVPKTLVKKFFTIKGSRQNIEFGFARIDIWERYQLDKEGLQVIAVPDTKKYFVIKNDVAPVGDKTRGPPL